MIWQIFLVGFFISKSGICPLINNMIDLYNYYNIKFIIPEKISNVDEISLIISSIPVFIAIFIHSPMLLFQIYVGTAIPTSDIDILDIYSLSMLESFFIIYIIMKLIMYKYKDIYNYLHK